MPEDYPAAPLTLDPYPTDGRWLTLAQHEAIDDVLYGYPDAEPDGESVWVPAADFAGVFTWLELCGLSHLSVGPRTLCGYRVDLRPLAA